MKFKINIFIAFVFFTSCTNKKEIIPILNSETDKWVQYKKVPILDLNDTLPFKDTYLILDGNLIYYYKYNKLEYLDTLLLSKNKTFFLFKNNTGDRLFIDSVKNKILLKRDDFDGDYEYFEQKPDGADMSTQR